MPPKERTSPLSLVPDEVHGPKTVARNGRSQDVVARRRGDRRGIKRTESISFFFESGFVGPRARDVRVLLAAKRGAGTVV